MIRPCGSATVLFYNLLRKDICMKSILKYLNAYKKEVVLAPFFKLLEAFFELFVPLVVADIIDNGIYQKDSSSILFSCLIMIVLGIIGLCCAVCAQFFAARAAVGFSARVKQALFDHIQKFSYTDLDTVGTSSLITNMTSDINQVQTGVNLVLRLFLRSPVIVFGAVIMAFLVNAEAAIPFVILIPALSIIVFGIMLISIPLYKKVQKRLDKLLGITRENLNGVRVVRAFNRQTAETEAFENANQDLNALQKFAGKISALMNPLTFVIVNVAIIFLIRGGAIRVNQGDISQGELIALYNYMTQILVELVKLASLIITVTKATACGNRIGDVLKKEPQEWENASHSDSNDTESAIVFQNVSMTYKDAAAESLENVSFAIKRGQTLGIIGSTGSGKSTLVNLIPRFYPINKGQILINGADINSYSEQALREKIGVVSQKSVLFKGTVRSNMQWGDSAANDDAINEALRTAQAYDFVMEKDGGLDAPVDAGGRNFSGGQRQRLCIARALVKQPEILILDDSSSALDFATDAKLRTALRNLPYSPTTVIVSQRTSSILHADQIVVLDDGEMVGVGTHKELMENCPVYIEIYQSQFKGNEGENK